MFQNVQVEIFYQGSTFYQACYIDGFDIRVDKKVLFAQINKNLPPSQEQLLKFSTWTNLADQLTERVTHRIEITDEIAKTITLSARMFQYEDGTMSGQMQYQRRDQQIPIAYPVFEIGKCYRICITNQADQLNATFELIDDETSQRQHLKQAQQEIGMQCINQAMQHLCDKTNANTPDTARLIPEIHEIFKEELQFVLELEPEKHSSKT